MLCESMASEVEDNEFGRGFLCNRIIVEVLCGDIKKEAENSLFF